MGSFDKKVHHKDPKTGQLAKTTPYRYFVDNRGQRYQRNGIDYHPDGSRVDMSQKEILPKSKVEQNLDGKLAQMEKLAKELEASKAELAAREEALKVKESALQNQDVVDSNIEAAGSSTESVATLNEELGGGSEDEIVPDENPLAGGAAQE